MQFIVSSTGHVLGTHTFAHGFVPAQRNDLRRLSEEEATAHAAWLENHVSWEVAFDFIDEWSTGKLMTTH